MKTIKKTLILCLSIALILFLNACEKDDPFKDEYEPNNSITEAIELTLETQINASISKGDHDFYSFTIVDNQKIIKNALIELGNFSDNLQLVCSIYDDLGNLRVTYEGGAGTGYAIKWPTTGGSYFLEISDKSGDEEGHYTIKVTDLNDNDDNEPNDTFSQATVISSYPTGNISGTIVVTASTEYPNGDFDFFLVLVSANKKVDFTVSPLASDLELHFKIYDESQILVDEGLDGNDGQVLNFYLNNPSGSDVTMYIKLGGILGESLNGNYTISFTESDAT